MVLEVRNPETNRYIRVNGTVYSNLEKRGVSIPLDDVRTVQKNFEPVLDKKVKKARVKKSMNVDRSDTSWADKKPQTKKEREAVLEKCGKVCFLIPEDEKFPICNKLETEESPCEYNCKGLKAASSRAGEWKYKNVLEKSKELTKKLDCYVNKEKKVQKQKHNKYFKKMLAAKKENKAFFMYKGNKFVKTIGKNGIVLYKKSKIEKK